MLIISEIFHSIAFTDLHDIFAAFLLSLSVCLSLHPSFLTQPKRHFSLLREQGHLAPKWPNGTETRDPSGFHPETGLLSLTCTAVGVRKANVRGVPRSVHKCADPHRRHRRGVFRVPSSLVGDSDSRGRGGALSHSWCEQLFRLCSRTDHLQRKHRALCRGRGESRGQAAARGSWHASTE